MPSIFFSYSHRDETWRDELEIHLHSLQRQGLIDTWHDRRIRAGDDIDHSISEHLESASLILLLVSPYFIASDYCYDVEMTRALERHKAGDARVIPVILEPCDWHGLPFGRLRVVPEDGVPVSKHANFHDAFLDIVRAIRDALPATGVDRPATEPVSRAVPSEDQPRSSNLRIKKRYTDEDRHRFLQASFEYLSRFFEGSVAELSARNADITGQVRRLSADRFTVILYRSGDELASGTIWLGEDFGSGHAINYCHGIQSGCVFHAMPVTHSTGSRSVIPRHPGH